MTQTNPTVDIRQAPDSAGRDGDSSDRFADRPRLEAG